MQNILIEKSKSCILNLFKFIKFQLFIRLVLLVFCLSMMIASAKADYFEEGAEPGVLSSIKIKGEYKGDKYPPNPCVPALHQ